MRAEPGQSLRWRFTAASMALVAIVTALCAFAFYAAQDYTEDQLLVELMQREVDNYAAAFRLDPSHPPPASTQLRSYVVESGGAASLPRELRRIPPGIHHDIEIGDSTYQVANFTLGDSRLYLAFDITDVERREHWLQYSLVAFVLLATGLAGLLGWRVSRVVLRPVTRLAESIRDLDPRHPAGGFPEHPSDLELGVIASAFDGHLRRLAEFVERERAFTEDASHELRTPIAVISSAAERLAADPALPPELRAPLERIERAGRQMQATTQALLFLAREDGAAADGEPVPLPVLARELIDGHRLLVGDKPVALELDAVANGAVPVPRGLATLVVGNLLHNAIANTATGSVCVTVAGDRLEVRDTGEGIPAADLPQVFERRFRGPHSAGLGLGLHIVKRVCDRRGWALSVSSVAGAGTTFTVRFLTKS